MRKEGQGGPTAAVPRETMDGSKMVRQDTPGTKAKGRRIGLLFGSIVVVSVFLLGAQRNAARHASVKRPLGSPSSNTAKQKLPQGTELSAEECKTFRESLRSGSRREDSPVPLYTRRNSTCWSRAEWSCYQPKLASPPSEPLLALLQHYKDHWRRCIALESPKAIKEKILQGAPLSCNYTFWVPRYGGIGNQLMSLSTAFVYSLLTGRIMYVDPTSIVPGLFCEPFEDTPSWFFPESFEFTSMRAFQDALAKGRTFSPRDLVHSNYNKKPPQVLNMYMYYKLDMQPFFCDDYHKWAEQSNALLFSSNMYWVPAMYHVPRLRAALEMFFPNNKVFATLAPILFHPENQVWGVVTRFLEEHSHKGEGQRGPVFGIQYRDFIPWFWAVTSMKGCLTRMDANLAGQLAELVPSSSEKGLVQGAQGTSGIVEGASRPHRRLRERQRREGGEGKAREHPDGNDSMQSAGVVVQEKKFPRNGRQANSLRGWIQWSLDRLALSEGQNQTESTLLVAALNNKFTQGLEDLLNSTHRRAHMIRLTQDKAQNTEESSHNVRALVEMFILALGSDAIVITPSSTFGYSIVGFSSSKPYYFSPPGGCRPAHREPCFLVPPQNFKCRSSKARFPSLVGGGYVENETENYLEACPDLVWQNFGKPKLRMRIDMGLVAAEK